MKTTLFAVLFFCVFLTFGYGQNTASKKFHNKIDDIKTAKDIKKLLVEIDKERFEDFRIREDLEVYRVDCQKIVDDLNIKPWTKADFDNNGYTDLLIVESDGGHSNIAIIDSGGNSFYIETLPKSFFPTCSFPLVEEKGNDKIIVYNKFVTDRTPVQNLIYKFGGFVEPNENPKEYKIEKIEYETGICYGTCPSFELKINFDRTAEYNAKIYNKKKGKFTGKILQSNYDELVGLLNYIDFPNLKDNYSVNWTDDQTSILKITYNNGKVKTIKDYGLIGTFGLNRVYSILFDLRENQQWK